MYRDIIVMFITGLMIQISYTNLPSCHPSYRSQCIDDDDTDKVNYKHTHCILKKTYTTSGVVVVRGAVNESECISNAALSSLRNPDCKLTNPPVNTVCYDCCTEFQCDHNSRYCNKMDPINPDYMPSYMKIGPGPTSQPYSTVLASTHAPATVSSSTNAPTMTSASLNTITTTRATSHNIATMYSQSTTSTAKSTTTDVSTTASQTATITTVPTMPAVPGTRCLSCTEDSNNRCSSADHVDCSDRPYCLNEVIYSGGNWTRTDHRCASRVECYWDYWIGTRSDPMCDQTGVCTYCCESSGDVPCNLNKEKPGNLTDFNQQQTQVHTCIVTDHQNGETTHDCTEKEGRFCMNNVYYDTRTNIPTYVTKKCALEDECRGLFLKSRKIEACVTGNMTGVLSTPTNHSLLCHYCCESNGNVPCNGKPRPDQIEQFIQPTTTTVTTSATTASTTSTNRISTTPTASTTPTNQISTTPTASTTPTVLATNSTAAATNATVTITTASTTMTTPLTTTPTPNIKCHICGDPRNSIPCSRREIITPQINDCPTPYCMTDIIQDANGNADVYKRCANDRTCRKEWISETADEDYCKQYGVVTNPAAFTCHFCCTTDGCNSGLVPNSTTWYTLHN